jgi:hypothetical protein
MDERDAVTRALHLRFERSAAAGFAMWCAWGLGLWAGVWGQDHPLGVIDWLTLLGPACIVPLGLRIARPQIAQAELAGWRRLIWLQPLGMACTGLAFALPRGRWAAAIAAPWMLAAWMIARLGSTRLQSRASTSFHERALDVAFIDLFVGAFMMVISRTGYAAFGLIEPILTLASRFGQKNHYTC